MTPAQELLASIHVKRAEQAKCLAELDLWAAVQAQGIDIGTVATFGFKPEWITRIERAQQMNAVQCRKPDPMIGMYNFVRHRDGIITRLQPTLRVP